MSDPINEQSTRTQCPECGFEVPLTDDCSLCGHVLDEASDPA